MQRKTLAEVTGQGSHEMVSRLVNIYANIPDDLKALGQSWYRHVRDVDVASIVTETGVDATTVACVVAALSPQLSWSRNLSAALEVCDQADAAFTKKRKPAGVMGRSYEKALAVLDDRYNLDLLGNLKTRAFAHSIITAGTGKRVTIDIWAVRAALGVEIVNADNPLLKKCVTEGRYQQLETVYRLAASWVHKNPEQFQAIVWCGVRGKAW